MKHKRFITTLKKAFKNAILRIKKDNNFYKVLSIQYTIKDIFKRKKTL